MLVLTMSPVPDKQLIFRVSFHTLKIKTTTKTIHVTSTVTCYNSPLSTSVGKFTNGLTNWVPSKQGNGYYSTGASYDGTGSAAVLGCTFGSTFSQATIQSMNLNVCPGQTYTLSFKYKFPASGSHAGALTLYDIGAALGTLTGPAGSGAKDSAGVVAGQWATYSKTFKATSAINAFSIAQACYVGAGTSGKATKVTIDNVRLTRGKA
ncbi:hypothetical protein MBLNU459_g6317t1 [Dothideomycetes sp. NU459]